MKLGVVALQKKPINWYIILMHPYPLIKDFTQDIEGSIAM